MIWNWFLKRNDRSNTCIFFSLDRLYQVFRGRQSPLVGEFHFIKKSGSANSGYVTVNAKFRVSSGKVIS